LFRQFVGSDPLRYIHFSGEEVVDKGINPFTKERAVFKARPARKVVRARPAKAAKDAV
jgi:hypothetical protein